MVDLILKTKEVNTLRDRRLEALQEGKPLLAQYNGYTGHMGPPMIESVGVSYEPTVMGGGVFKDQSVINGLLTPQLHGDVKINGLKNFLDLRMDAFGGRTVRQAFADGTLSQFIEDKHRGVLNARMDGNSLLENWQALVDAARIQLAINKAINPTVREFFYNVLDRPNATAIEKVNELFPGAVIFEENDGTGEQVEMGEMRGGQYDTIEQVIYAAGMTYDLNKYLFDPTLDMNKVNEAVALGENGKKDDTALAPIINFSYSGGQQTAANTSGDTREENWWFTLSDARDDIVARRDPVTQDRLVAANCTILAHPIDAGRIAEILPGFANVRQNVKVRGSLDYIRRVVGYEGARIQTRSKGLITYTDVTQGTCYIAVPHRRMIISRKRPLQLNIDANPDVLRLAQQAMAWYYCEGVYNDGIGYSIQEVTLPTW